MVRTARPSAQTTAMTDVVPWNGTTIPGPSAVALENPATAKMAALSGSHLRAGVEGGNQWCSYTKHKEDGDHRVLQGERINIVEAFRGRRGPNEASRDHGEGGHQEAKDP